MIQADISALPLDSNTLDVGVFCLSLMGTNFPQFLREANRVLKKTDFKLEQEGGKLLVAEVVSRFPDGDCKEFLRLAKEEAGFTCLKVAKLKDFFYVMVLRKDRDARGLPGPSKEFTESLRPCLYKKR